MNNRQAGRRRGRGGQRQGGNPGRPDNGNRIDNRARGNAAQLLEKYKNLAQDAQRSGDRVTTEYYLQFADHYFRVLAESRSRFEENNARRQAQDAETDEGDEEYGFEGEAATPAAQAQQQNYGDESGDEPRRGRDRDNQGGNRREAREPREDRNANRRDRARDSEREAGDAVDANRATPVEPRRLEPANDPAESAEAPAEPRRRGRPRRVVDAAPEEEAGFDAALLPPSIAVEAEAAPAEERPRRGRPRRVRTEDEVVPPAA